MHTRGRLDGAGTWLAWGSAALLLHLGTLLAMDRPGARVDHAVRDTHMLWLQADAPGSAGQQAAPSPGAPTPAAPRAAAADGTREARAEPAHRAATPDRHTRSAPASAEDTAAMRAVANMLAELTSELAAARAATAAEAAATGEPAAADGASRAPTEHGALAGNRADSTQGAGLAAPSDAGQAAGGHASTGAGRTHALRGPELLSMGRPCGGYFPASARANHGEVQIVVEVDPLGRAHPDRVLAEYPLGQGFGRAARACAGRLRFNPGLDLHGTAVTGRARLKLHFDRS